MDGCIQRQECDTCKQLYDEKISALDNRITGIEADAKQIHELAVQIAEMTTILKNLTKEIEKQGERLTKIETEPAEKWKKAVWIVVAALIGAGISYILTHIGLS